jgi:ABC-type multidrug transport system ATPase subunit
MNDYVLRTAGLGKKYGNTCALQDVNIEIRRGQIYGLIGQNGAGKTTLMRAVTGLIFVSDGEIELFGKKASAICRQSGAGLDKASKVRRFIRMQRLLKYSKYSESSATCRTKALSGVHWKR